MAAEPFTSGDPAFLADLPDDLFGTVGSGPDEAEFWTEADQTRSGSWAAARPRRHRRASRKTAAAGATEAAVPAVKKPSRRGRLAAAWAAESSARRALRFRPEGAPKEPRRGRKVAAALVGVIALVAAGVAVADLLDHGGSSDRESELADPAGLAPGSDPDTRDASTAADPVVESRIVDATPSDRSSSTTKKPAATKPKATTPAAKPKTTTPAKPSTAGATPPPATPAPAPVPTTAAPKPVTPTTAVPTTAPPPAKPAVKAFTATVASSPGGSCPVLQWATTFRWDTTSATSVAITGLLEQTQGSLPADGSKTVCRALPGGPLGGWTLTATGAGGSTTATA